MDELHGNNMNLKLAVDDTDRVYRIVHAMASPVRLGIMRLLQSHNMSVLELSERLNVPLSTVSSDVRILEAAEFIRSEKRPGNRGQMKLCWRAVATVSVDFEPPREEELNIVTMNMPIGAYSSADGIEPSCGIVNQLGGLGEADAKTVFYLPERLSAQLIWFHQGSLEYRFTLGRLIDYDVSWLEISFEACSDTSLHRDPWKSDIALSINERRVGIWTSPADCGGRRGKYSPGWWSEDNSNFGFLKTWRITREGTWLDDERISDVTLDDVDLHKYDHVRLRIGVPADAEHVGGMCLFGESFGDHSQPIVLRIGYKLKRE